MNPMHVLTRGHRVAEVRVAIAGAAAALAVLSVASVALVHLSTGAAGASLPAAPYSDPRASGSIGLCNAREQQITSGSIKSTPFVARAVSSVSAESTVSGSGRTATLYAYQPVKGEDPAYWSGQALTGASLYTNPSAPTAVSTDRDLPLSNFLAVFPPSWEGFIQLRIYLGAPNQSPYVATYPTVNLYITGDTWQVVGGSTVNCDSGQAVSREAVLGVPGAATSTTVAGSVTTTTATTIQPGTGGGSSGPVASTQPKAAGAAAAAADVAAHPSSSAGPVIGLIAVAAIVVGLGIALVIRHRRRVAR